MSYLDAPFEVDTLLEIRTSRMKTMPGTNIKSGIDKKPCSGRMKIDKLGLTGDEHDPTFHGGLDKAIMGYCSSHYSRWQEQHPERADRFVPGAFGENFVTSRMNENNVCIGDIISVGDEVILQVSLSRQPCYKLNQRFSLKNFAPTTFQTNRTGWYYRVVREGYVSVGDELRLVERKWPKWTIARLQEFLHHDKTNQEMNAELSNVDALGEESKGEFRSRVAKQTRAPKKLESWREFKVVGRKMETPRIVSLLLEAVNLDPEVDNSLIALLVDNTLLGGHVRIKLPTGLERTYSVVSGDGERFSANNKFELGIALDEKSRGGSQFFHEILKVDDVIQVGKITTSLRVGATSSHHVIIAGGIGITPFLMMIKAMKTMNFAFTLHYAVRSGGDVPFRERLELWGDSVKLYDASKGQRMDVKKIVETVPWNSHLYVCGPNRLMEATKAAVDESTLTADDVHYEAFSADVSGDPFEAKVSNRDGKVVKVGEDESLLEALRREFGDAPSSCEVGNCGTCRITLKSGRVDHRGTALLPEEKETCMLACVSRGVGLITVEV